MIREKLYRWLRAVSGGYVDFDLAPAVKPEFGHYSTNLALRLAKERGRSPMATAKEIAERIRRFAPTTLIQDIQVAPPGFINFWLSPEAFQDELREIIRQGEEFGKMNLGRGRTVILEYSSPNIAKPMHVGHLRNTVLGDALARIYEFLGYKVIRWNYLGDWGTQFGNLIAAYKKWGKRREVEKKPIETLLALYVRFHRAAGEHPELEELGRQEFKKLESGDRENRRLWFWFRKASMREFARIYRVLGVKFDVEIGESFFNPDTGPLILELEKKKIAVESQGALIIPLTKQGLPPALIRKADGTSLYLTREIANLKYRLRRYKPVKILYVVGNEQSLHFEQLFAVAEILGLAGKAELVHVKYGLVLDEGGKKFSTRRGRIISAADVLAKAVRLARETVEKKNPHLTAREKAKIAAGVGVAAVKYVNLRENRKSTVIFDWKKMLDFSGDSAPYLQYTYARLRSIWRKAGRGRRQVAGGRRPAVFRRLVEEQELALVRKMGEFPEIVRAAALAYAPNILAVYLYELANAVNSYYESTPILKDEEVKRKNARLALIVAASKVIKTGLGLLGLAAPERI